MQRRPMTQRRSSMNSTGLEPIFEAAGAVGGLLAAHYLDHMYREGMEFEEVEKPTIEGALSAPLDHQVVMAGGALAGFKVGVALA